MRSAIILDTSAFIMGYEANGSEEYFTTPKVYNELKKDTFPEIRLANSISTGKIRRLTPEIKFQNRIDSETRKLRETDALSNTDKEVLALGLQLQEADYSVVIVSDDYGIQNVAESLGIKYRGLSTKGIRRKISWEIYCPGCRKRFENHQEDNICPICGTPLKRRPRNKKKARRKIV